MFKKGGLLALSMQVLKKQVGKLLSKRGAMFGLDARVSLAIFGALSLISGAALFSAIDRSKAIKHMQQFQEIIKSIEAYYLDTGSMLHTDDGLSYYIGSLEYNHFDRPGWKGPYLRTGDGHLYRKTILWFNIFGVTTGFGQDVRVLAAPKAGWNTNCQAIGGVPRCTSDDDCHLYLYTMSEAPEMIGYYKNLDEVVDGGDDSCSDGKVRYRYPARGTHYVYYYAMPIYK